MINITKTALIGFLFGVFFQLTAHSQGINFLPGSYNSAVEASRRANKILFVEVYLNGCPHCAALAPILLQKKIGDFFNTNFVNYKLEANSEDSKAMQQQKGITYVEFPLFFFFDPTSGQLLHQAAPGEHLNKDGSVNVPEMIEEVLKHGKDAVSPETRTSSYPGRYAKGERDLAFLVNYAKNVKATKDNDRLYQLNNDIAKIFTKASDLESPTGFYIISRLINDFSNPMATHFFKNLDKYKAKFPAKEVKEAGELITYNTLYLGKRANQLDIEEVINIRNAMVKLGLTSAEASRRTILKEIDAYFRIKATAKAAARFTEYSRTAPNIAFQDYAYLSRYFNEKATDNSYVPYLLKWVDSGVKLLKPAERNTKEAADIYIEQAKAYKRIGKTAEAKKSAQNAVTIAKAAKTDLKPYNDELAKIK